MSLPRRSACSWGSCRRRTVLVRVRFASHPVRGTACGSHHRRPQESRWKTLIAHRIPERFKIQYSVTHHGWQPEASTLLPSSYAPRYDDTTWQVASHVPTQRLFIYLSIFGDQNGELGEDMVSPLVAKKIFFFMSRPRGVNTDHVTCFLPRPVKFFAKFFPRFCQYSPIFAKAVAPTGVSGVDG